MTSKVKQQAVSSARTRLDATLQYLVDKKEDSSHSLSEGEGSAPLSELRITPSSKKSSLKPNRKRKRREDSEEYDEADTQQTLVMKLFDRSVDLAKFLPDTPLYPVCRAWIHNRPHDKTLGTLGDQPASPDRQVKEEEILDGFPSVYEMPFPIKSEDGCLYDLRVPKPVLQEAERLDIYADPKQAPTHDQLLLDHMTRWKEVRRRWREASVMNEMQYASSVQVLKDIFDRNMVDERM